MFTGSIVLLRFAKMFFKNEYLSEQKVVIGSKPLKLFAQKHHRRYLTKSLIHLD